MQQIGKDFKISATHACGYYRFSSDDDNTRVILWGYPNYNIVTGSKGEPRYIGDVVFCIDGSPTVVRGPVPPISSQILSLSPNETNDTQTLSCPSGETTIIKLGGFSYSTKSFQSFHENSETDSFDIKQVFQFGENVYVRTNLGVHILTEGRDCTTVTIRYIPIQSTCMAFREDYLFIFQKYSVSKYALNGDLVEVFNKVTPLYKFDEFFSVLLINTVFIVATSNGDLCSIDKNMNIKSIVHPELCHRPFVYCNTLYTTGIHSHKIRLFQSAEFIASEQAKSRCVEAMSCDYANQNLTISCNSTPNSDADDVIFDAAAPPRGIPQVNKRGDTCASVDDIDCDIDDGCDGLNDLNDKSRVVGTWLHLNDQTITLQECVDLDKLKIIIDNFKDPNIQTSIANFKTRHTNTNGNYISNALCGYYDLNSSSQTALKSLYKYLSENNGAEIVTQSPSNIALLQVAYRQKGLWILGGSGGCGYGDYGRYGWSGMRTDAGKSRAPGRYFSTSVLSFQNMSKPLRQTLCSSIYWDVDMVNAFPTILSQYCKTQHIQCTVVDQYVANRDEIIKKSGMTKDVFKSHFFSVLTQSTTKTSGVSDPFARKFFADLSNEINWVALHFARQHPTQIGFFCKHKSLSLDDSHRYIMIGVLCSIENEIMWHAFQFLKEQGYHPDVLCFDGFMVRQQGEVTALDRTLLELSAFIRRKTAYDVCFIVKPMTEAIDLSKLVETPSSQWKPQVASGNPK